MDFLWKLVILLGIVGLIEAGVKIEISRVKDPPKIATLTPPNMDGVLDKLADNDMTTETTPTTMQTTTESTTMPTTTTEVITIKPNDPNNPISEITTIAPPNNGTVKIAQDNATNTNTLLVYNNTSMIVPNKDFNLYMSEFTKRQMRRQLIPEDYYCPCDLKINFCDVNCCCDVDCASREIKNTLKCSDRDWSIHDYEESSELQLCSQTQQFSLFCVVDNTRKRKQSRKRDFKVQDMNIFDVVQYKWSNQYDHQSFPKNDYREQYIFDDPILVWDETMEEIQFLDIPSSFGGAVNCRLKSPIKHLHDDEMRCVQTIDEHDQFLSDFQNKLRSVKVLKYRKSLDTASIIMKDICMSPSQANDTENCTTADIYHCMDTISLRTCKHDNNSTFSSQPDTFGIENAISDELSIQIHHNFTHILNVTVFFVYHELDGDSSTTHIVQKIQVEYLEMNETFATRDAHQVSGNIGYLHHKPIIVTKFVRLNESMVDSDGILAYFHNETNCTNDDHYMKTPAVDTNGDCIINNYTFQTVNFGENARIKCNAVLTPNEFNSSYIADQVVEQQNNTLICRAFQQKIFQYLLHGFELEDRNSTIYNRFKNRFSEMGNPKNSTEHWFDFKTVRPSDLNDILAVDSSNVGTSEFTCTNMVLGVRFEFFYGTTSVGAVSNQALIKFAQIHFGNRVNLKFKLDEDEWQVPLDIDTMFYDYSRVSNSGVIIRIIPVILLYIAILIAFNYWR